MKTPVKSITQRYEESRERDRAALKIMAERECSIAEAYLEVFNAKTHSGIPRRVGGVGVLRVESK